MSLSRFLDKVARHGIRRVAGSLILALFAFTVAAGAQTASQKDVKAAESKAKAAAAELKVAKRNADKAAKTLVAAQKRAASLAQELAEAKAEFAKAPAAKKAKIAASVEKLMAEAKASAAAETAAQTKVNEAGQRLAMAEQAASAASAAAKNLQMQLTALGEAREKLARDQKAEKKKLAQVAKEAEAKRRAQLKAREDALKLAEKKAAEAAKAERERQKRLAQESEAAKKRQEREREAAEERKAEAMRIAARKAREAERREIERKKRALDAVKAAEKAVAGAEEQLKDAQVKAAKLQAQTAAARTTEQAAANLVKQRASALRAAEDQAAMEAAARALEKAEAAAGKAQETTGGYAQELAAAQSVVTQKQQTLTDASSALATARTDAADALAAEQRKAEAEAAAKRLAQAERDKKEAARAEAQRLKAEAEGREAEQRERERAAREQAKAESAKAKAAKAAEAKRQQEAWKAERERAKEQEAAAARAKVAQRELRREEKKQARLEREAAAKARAEAEAAAITPRPVVVPKKHVREPLVSEPAPWTIEDVHEPPTLAGEKKIEAPPAVKADIADAARGALQFDLPMISGDKDIVEKLEVWQEWADYVTFNPVSPDEINEFHGKLVKALQHEGYVFAKVLFPTRIWAYGIFLAKVDCGPLGTIVVKGNRYYSAKQVIRALARQDGERFNYARIHGDLFDLNTKPDITIDAKLKPVEIGGRRVINAELEVSDDMPVHLAVELANTGTDHTNDWRFHTTLQHLNLSKRDDVLTVDWITSPDLYDLNAVSGSYFLPIGDEYSVSLYSGYSSSDIEDVMPQLDVRGEGFYVGGQVTKTLKDTPQSRWQVSGAYLFQHSETEHEVTRMSMYERKLDLSMPSVTLGYASRTFDGLGGRNFFSNTLQANFAGSLGSSAKNEFNEQGTAYTDGEFFINRFQLARVQRFFRGEDAPGKWTVFMKVDGQSASDTLITAVRKTLGGGNSVRGYREQEVMGDQALLATLELRTPLFHNFIPGLRASDEFLEANPDAWQRHRVQLVAFTDYGYASVKKPVAGEEPDAALFSAGLGLRLGLTKYSQLRFDYGYPFLKVTADTPPDGRGHLSLQLQF